MKTGKVEDSTSGWLSPDGDFYPCEKLGHLALTQELKNNVFKNELKINDDYYLEKVGWIKISQLRIYGIKCFTIQQIDFIARMILAYNMKKTIEVFCERLEVSKFFEKCGVV